MSSTGSSSTRSTSCFSGGIVDFLREDVGLAGDLVARLRPQARAVVLGRWALRQRGQPPCFASRLPGGPIGRLEPLAFLLTIGRHGRLLSGGSGPLGPMSPRVGPTGLGTTLESLMNGGSSVGPSFVGKDWPDWSHLHQVLDGNPRRSCSTSSSCAARFNVRSEIRCAPASTFNPAESCQSPSPSAS